MSSNTSLLKTKSILSYKPLVALDPQKPNDDQPGIHPKVISQTSIVLSEKHPMVLNVSLDWIIYQTSGSSLPAPHIPPQYAIHMGNSTHSEVLSRGNVRHL